MTPALGVGLPLDSPVSELVAAAQEAEALGCSFLWANDDRLQHDLFGVLSAIAIGTERMQVGPGVTNPYSRHPALLAAAIATLDEISGGRAVLGLGAGGTNHRALGVERTAPVATLREAIDLVRRLLNGETVTVESHVVSRDAVLGFEPVRPDVPIYLGARGPRMLELAGEIADAAIVGNLATVEGWRYARDRVRIGMDRAGRGAGEVSLTAWFYCSIDDEESVAADAIRPMVATSLVTSRAILDDLGLVMPAEFARIMDGFAWNPSETAVREAGASLPAEALEWFGLAGTPSSCRAKLTRLIEAFPEITQVAIVPAAPVGGSIKEVIRRFLTEVAPGLQSSEAESTTT